MPKSWSRTLLLVYLEAVLVTLCGVAALYIRFGSEAGKVFLEQRGWLKILVLMFVVQGAFYLFDLYDFRIVRVPVRLYLGIIQAVGLASICMAVLFYAVPQMTLGRGVFTLSLILTLSVTSCWRVFAMWAISHPRLAERVLVLGTTERAVNIARETLDRPEMGYEIVGFVGNDPTMIGKNLINPMVVGVMPQLEEVVRKHYVDRIVIAIEDRRGSLPTGSLLKLKLRDGMTVEDHGSFYERLTGKINTETLMPSWLIFSNKSGWARVYKRARRAIDFAISLLGLLISLPISLLTVLLIKLESPGPVFYTQNRVGMHQKEFKIIKFRSMHQNAEQHGAVWADERDPRVTRVGRVIRTLRIDELPQFINIIRGEMSFIGPRPERPEFTSDLEREIPYYSYRHLVRPGLTGWAQVSYPYGASVEDAIEKLKYDLYYIKNQSPMVDMLILFATVRLVLFGRGAR